MKPRGTQELNSNSYNSQRIKEKMYWISLNELETYRTYPTFFSEKLKNMREGIEHIVTHEY